MHVRKRMKGDSAHAVVGAEDLHWKWRSRWQETYIKAGLFLCALLSIATTIAIILVLVLEAFSFFRDVPLLEFLLGTTWTPLLKPHSFGVLPLVCGTLLVVAGSALIAVPVGLASRDLFERVCVSPHTQPPEADFGNSCRDSDRGLRLLCALVRDAHSCEYLSARAGI